MVVYSKQCTSFWKWATKLSSPTWCVGRCTTSRNERQDVNRLLLNKRVLIVSLILRPFCFFLFVACLFSFVCHDQNAHLIQKFFVVVEAKRKDISGQCTKRDGDCKGREIRDSRYNDMKASMYLLANAFRTDQQKPPDRLRTLLCTSLLLLVLLGVVCPCRFRSTVP
jgi:hypothetical protein